MTTSPNSQALCGPFSLNELPSFQAAVEHLESQWREPLPTLAARIVYAAISVTAKFNRSACRLSARFLRRGLKRNAATGFSGLAAFIETEQAINNALNLLYSTGVFRRDARGRTTIDYSKTAYDLVQCEDIRKSVKRRYSHNPYMRTCEGIIEWAAKLTSWLLPQNTKETYQNGSTTSVSSNKECESGVGSQNQSLPQSSTAQQVSADANSVGTMSGTLCNPSTTSVCVVGKANSSDRSPWIKPNGNQCLGYPESYSFSYRTTPLSGDKSPSSIWDRVMSNAESIKAAVLASVAAGRNRLQEKRIKRANISDLCTLFEDAWRKGQHERDSSILPSRLVARDRKLLKDQVIYPSRDVDMDVRDFAHWVALHWDAIGATYFEKAKSYPDAPAFRWFVRCLETYTTAYQNRAHLDPNAKRNTPQRVSTVAVQAVIQQADKAVTAAATELDDLRRQLAEAHDKNQKLRLARGLDADDDPVYSRAIKAANRKVVIGSYDDEPAPKRVKLKRKSK